jgi:hypothetical protein
MTLFAQLKKLRRFGIMITSSAFISRTEPPMAAISPGSGGKTPIKEILQLMRKEKWTFPADIELEYKIPEGSTAVAEVARCLAAKRRSPEWLIRNFSLDQFRQ